MPAVAQKPATTAAAQDYKIADIKLAPWGRREIAIAEIEMPGLMAIREEYTASRPLKGARITGSLHMTIQTAVLIETLRDLGAEIRWASCNIYSTQDHAAAAIADAGIPVFAVKGESLTEYWEYTHQIFEWADGGFSNMILDDGGDATLLLHLGTRAESDITVLDKPTSEEERILYASIKKRVAAQPGWYSERLAAVKGVTEETTTGVHRLYQMHKRGELKFPAINVNDSVTKSKFDNLYGCRESLVDGIKRATDVMIAGKVAVVAGYGDVGKGSAQAASRPLGAGLDHRDRPHLRLAGGDGRLPGRDHGVCRRQGGHLRDHHRQLQGYHARPHGQDEESGHRLQHRPLRQRDRRRLARRLPLGRDQAAGRPRHFPRRQADHPARQGSPRESRLRDRPPVLRHEFVGSPTRLWRRSNSGSTNEKYPVGVYVLPKKLDEHVARLQLKTLNVQLTELTPEQAAYIHVAKEGPYKTDQYRY